MRFTTVVTAGFSLVAGAAAFGSKDMTKAAVTNATSLPPSQDPWYSAPAGFEDKAPGTILKMRAAPDSTLTAQANASAAYNILYRTTNSRYEPTFAVTTLFVPENPDCTKLLSYQIPYDSADVDASPSFTLQSTPEPDISAALGRGWFVSSPDYEGPLASFVAGVMSGHATIDSVRAVLAAGLDLSPDTTRYAMWGYSGGALASEWAAELQVQYAPELNFSGTALGGLTPNVTSVLFTVDATIYTGLVPAGILGLASQYPELQAFLNSTLKQTGPMNITGFYAVKQFSLTQAIGAYLNQHIEDYFVNGFDALSSPQAREAIANDGLMGYHGLPQMPLFVYKAIGDDISVIADTDELVDRYCLTQFSSIVYDRNTVGNHVTESGNGDARAFAFLTSVLEGSYNVTGCHIQNVTVPATSS